MILSQNSRIYIFLTCNIYSNHDVSLLYDTTWALLAEGLLKSSSNSLSTATAELSSSSLYPYQFHQTCNSGDISLRPASLYGIVDILAFIIIFSLLRFFSRYSILNSCRHLIQSSASDGDSASKKYFRYGFSSYSSSMSDFVMSLKRRLLTFFFSLLSALQDTIKVKGIFLSGGEFSVLEYISALSTLLTWK